MQNSQIKTNILEAVRLGYDRCRAIADYLGERPEVVYGILGDLVFEKRLEKYEKGGRLLYRPPGALHSGGEPEQAENLSAQEIEVKILAAIREAPRTLSQLKRACDLHFSADISDLLENLLSGGKIRSSSNGNITAFFPFSKKPKNFWLSGLNYVDAVYDEQFDAAAEDERVEQNRRKTREAQAFNPALTTGQKEKESRVILLDEASLERAAAERGSQKETALALGIGYSTLTMKMAKDPALKAAFRRGQENFKNNEKPEAVERVEPEKENTKSSRRSSPAKYTAEMFYAFGAEGLTQIQIAARLGKHHTSICHQLAKPELRAAFDRGRRRFEESKTAAADSGESRLNPQPENQLGDLNGSAARAAKETDHSTGPPSGGKSAEPPVSRSKDVMISEDIAVTERHSADHSPEGETSVGGSQSLEIFRPAPADRAFEFAFINNQIQPQPESVKSVAVGKGSLNLTLEVNLFETSREERNFLCDLIDRIEEFEAKR